MQQPHYIVIGWYGTETAGDKAILGGIVDAIHRIQPDAHFTIVSSTVFYTRNTLQELGYEQFDVISYSMKHIKLIMPGATSVLMGGGPLMDLVEVFDFIRIFQLARKHRVLTALIGIGLGPVKRRFVRWGIRRLVLMADTIMVRDAVSLQKLLDMGVDASRVVEGADPATVYVRSIKENLTAFQGPTSIRNSFSYPDTEQTVLDEETAGAAIHPSMKNDERPLIGMAIRDWPRKYAVNMSDEDYQRYQAFLVKFWAKLGDALIEKYNVSMQMIPMNTFHIGDDDRWLHADVYRHMTHKAYVLLNTATYSAAQVASLINQCRLLIGMRFHSVLFGTTLAVPTLAIDYTQGRGKVSAYMQKLAQDELVLLIDELELDTTLTLFEHIWQHQDTIHTALDKKVTKIEHAARTGIQQSLKLHVKR